MKTNKIVGAVIALSGIAIIACNSMGSGHSNTPKATPVEISTVGLSKVKVNLSETDKIRCQKEESGLEKQLETSKKANLELDKLGIAMNELLQKIKNHTATVNEIASYNKSVPKFDKMKKDNESILNKLNASVKAHNISCKINPNSKEDK